MSICLCGLPGVLNGPSITDPQKRSHFTHLHINTNTTQAAVTRFRAEFPDVRAPHLLFVAKYKKEHPKVYAEFEAAWLQQHGRVNASVSDPTSNDLPGIMQNSNSNPHNTNLHLRGMHANYASRPRSGASNYGLHGRSRTETEKEGNNSNVKHAPAHVNSGAAFTRLHTAESIEGRKQETVEDAWATERTAASRTTSCTNSRPCSGASNVSVRQSKHSTSSNNPRHSRVGSNLNVSSKLESGSVLGGLAAMQVCKIL